MMIRWMFRRSGSLPILNAVGGCNEKDKEAEIILIGTAVEYIDKAGDFNGIPHAISPNFANIANMEIAFSIMFPTENDIQEFTKTLIR